MTTVSEERQAYLKELAEELAAEADLLQFSGQKREKHISDGLRDARARESENARLEKIRLAELEQEKEVRIATEKERLAVEKEKVHAELQNTLLIENRKRFIYESITLKCSENNNALMNVN